MTRANNGVVTCVCRKALSRLVLPVLSKLPNPDKSSELLLLCYFLALSLSGFLVAAC